MSFILDEMDGPEPTAAKIEGGRLHVDLIDGRTIIVPIDWYPRLVHATPEEQNHIELDPIGLHWPDMNECISIAGLLAGGRSNEGEESFASWLQRRRAALSVEAPRLPLPDWWDDPLADEAPKLAHKETPTAAKRTG